MKTFRTPKGTELPLTNLKGKDYLEVKYRVQWFREDHPDWAIETEVVVATENSATIRAVVKDETGRIRGTGLSTETKQGFHDFIEKSETAAIGRALALCGYGTQFAAEMEEGEKLADAPIQKAAPIKQTQGDAVDPGDFVIQVGKKYRGKRLSEVSPQEIESFVSWLERNAKETGNTLSRDAIAFIDASRIYLQYGRGMAS